MANPGLSFGIVIAPTPKGLPDNVMADPTRATHALMRHNENAISTSRPVFDTVWAEDHFQWGKRPTLEAMTTLSYLIGKFNGMRFGHLVLGQSYRNPALTAKMAANLQVLSGGKFILGIGAGWKEDEYRAYGYPYPPAGVRMDQLEEAAQIIRAMWTQSPATFHGEHYSIDDAECQPQPDPPIPLMIAGSGEKRTLKAVARYADWWNGHMYTSDTYAHKQRVLAGHCRDIGRDPSEIVYTYYALVQFAESRDHIEKRSEHIVGGTADDITRELEEFISLGVSHIQIKFLDFPRQDGLHTFMEKVAPRLG